MLHGPSVLKGMEHGTSVLSGMGCDVGRQLYVVWDVTWVVSFKWYGMLRGSSVLRGMGCDVEFQLY